MRSPFVFIFLFIAAFATPSARAQEASEKPAEDARRLDARKLAQRGDRAFTIGRCDKAIPLWEQANEKFEAPTILFRIARCQALMGNVVDATQTLQAIVAQPPQPSEPAPFVSARRQAALELPNLRARIAKLRVVVDPGGLDIRPHLLIDMKPVARGVDVVSLDPGEHHVRVQAGGQIWERSVQVEEGKLKTVRVALVEILPPTPSRPQRTVGFVIGGIGLAAMAGGAYFGASAAITSTDLDDACGHDRKACPPGREDDIDRLRTHALLADFMLGGGAALFAAGSIVVLTENPPKRDEPRIEFYSAGVGGGVRGTF